MKEAAEPVRLTAEHRAVSEIRNVREGDPWSRMRVGATQRLVYVVPVQRGSRRAKRKRPKFADLMMERAMGPALDENIDEVEHRVDLMLTELGKGWESV